MKLSIVIPAYNEQNNIGRCLDELRKTLREKYDIDYEIVVVDDASADQTHQVVRGLMEQDPAIRMVRRTPPSGLGRAIRAGLSEVQGDVAVIYMADLSDDPEDVVAYFKKIQEGYDCVFGSRFMKGGKVENYPMAKRIANRIVNRCIQVMFLTRFNDLTNAFKAYRVSVIQDCGPYRASHFNITLELSLSALIRRYHIAQIPVRWYGRTWGSSNLNLRAMGRRYLSTLLMLFFERILVSDDLMAERLSNNSRQHTRMSDVEKRLEQLERENQALASKGDASVTP